MDPLDASEPTGPAAATTAACPLCATPLPDGEVAACPGCGLDLTHQAVAQLRELDRRLAELSAERDALVAELNATRAQPPPPPPPPPAGPPLPPPSGPPVSGPGSTTPRRHLGVPALLATAGVALLVTAAVVFTAVAWTGLPAAAQVAILAAVTLLAGVVALLLDRRELPTAAGAIGVLAAALAAIDVVGLQRTGLVDTAAAWRPLAALVAAAVALGLARAGLRWVATAGALATVLAGILAFETIATNLTLSGPAAVLVATFLALAVAATAPLWPTPPARTTVALAGALGLTVAGLAGAAVLAGGASATAAGLGASLLPATMLAVASRWRPSTLAAAVLVLTAVAAASVPHLDGETSLVPVAAGGVVLAAAWAGLALGRARRLAAWSGAAPAALIMAAVVLGGLGRLAARLVATIATVGETTSADPATGLVAVLLGAALLAVPGIRARAPEWLLLPVVLVIAGTLPLDAAWPVLLLAAIGAGLASLVLRWDALIGWSAATVAVGLAAGTAWTLALAAAMAAALAAATLPGTGRGRQRLGAALITVFAGAAVGAGTEAAGAHVDLALGAGLVAVFAAALALALLGPDRPPLAGGLVAAVATVLVPLEATTLAAAGRLLLLAALGWLAIAVAGWRHARWPAAVVAAAGSVVLTTDAGIDVVELHAAGPALLLATAGVWWLLEDRAVSTTSALAPALTVGLLPSLLTLTVDPRVLWRTLALTAAVAGLALLGLAARWLAPTLAAAITALWVAATQLWIVIELTPRWVTFALVGLVLVWLAATYERQQRRAVGLARRLRDLR